MLILGFLQNNKARLQADALIVSDTSMLAPGVPSVTYGLRGLVSTEVEITGPAQDLHSGVFGGAASNPLTILCELFAKMHDKNFRVTVPGFYDDVAKLSAAKEITGEAALQTKGFPENSWIARDSRAKKDFTVAEQVWCRPTLELNGIWGGYMGEGSKTVIPSQAHAKFSCRLVPNQSPRTKSRSKWKSTFGNYCRKL